MVIYVRYRIMSNRILTWMSIININNSCVCLGPNQSYKNNRSETSTVCIISVSKVSGQVNALRMSILHHLCSRKSDADQAAIVTRLILYCSEGCNRESSQTLNI